MKTKHITLLAVIAFLGLGIWWTQSDKPVVSPEINSFQDCVDAGYSVMESYPRQCQTDSGESFTEDIGNLLEKQDLVTVENPRPNETVTSTFTVSGEARGYWFFEGDFPLEVQDKNGNTIFEHYATAQDEWMTEDFVPFEVEVEISTSTTGQADLFLRRDNPSGLPENDDFVRIPITISN